MELEQLLRHLPGAAVSGPRRQDVADVTCDSRRVVPGSVFVAIRGFALDGHDFVDDAIARGAVVIVAERPVPVPDNVTLVQVAASRQALAALAAAFYGHPSRRLRLIGVTGTNGKTTTAFLIRALLKAAGHRTGLIGTVCNYVGDEPRPVVRTTPEAPELQRLLADMVAAGCTHAVMEVSSHALALGRVDFCEFDAAVFTNFSQDHLDFHQSLDEYLAVKATLFSRLEPGPEAFTPEGRPARYAVVNGDDAAASRIAAACRVPVHRFGFAGPAFAEGAAPLAQGAASAGAPVSAGVQADDIVIGPSGVSFTLVWPGGRLPLRLNLPGRFNVANALAATAVALAEGITPAVIATTLAQVEPVPGRLEAVDAGQEFSVFVDYAHTPDGLGTVLRTVRELQPDGQLIVVFGCGGDRDRAKRPLMGRLAGELADYVIVTSDNPRSENPDDIIRQIVAGVEQAGMPRDRYWSEPDRVRAIARALALADSGDIVLIAGKGHETVQEFADHSIHFDDRVVAATLLAERLGEPPQAAGGSIA